MTASAMDVKQGRRFDIKEFRPTRRPGVVLTRRAVEGERLNALRELTGPLLQGYGLELRSVTREILEEPNRPVRPGSAVLREDLRLELGLLHALSATAVVGSDAFGAGKTDRNKREVDRAAAEAHAFGQDLLFAAFSDVCSVVSAAEGGRAKRSTDGTLYEGGSNPARPFRQMTCPHTDNLAAFAARLAAHESISVTLRAHPAGRDDKVPDASKLVLVAVVSDDVDGTGKAAKGLHSSVTTSVYSQSWVKPLPDDYMAEFVSVNAVPKGTDLDTPFLERLAGMASANRVGVSDSTVFSLDRPRHGEPEKGVMSAGGTVVKDADGTIMPAVMASLRMDQFPNDKPLNGYVENVGGGPEALLKASVLFREGTVDLRMASKDNLQGGDWAKRYVLTGEEDGRRQEFGLPVGRFGLEDLWDDIRADGLAVYGGNTTCLWGATDESPLSPSGLLGVQFGAEGVSAHALLIDSDGRAEFLHIIMGYTQDEKTTRGMLRPFYTRWRGMADAGEIEASVRDLIRLNPHRARRAFEGELYPVLDRRIGDDGIRFLFDQCTYNEMRAMTGKAQVFTAVDDVVVNTVRSECPDWFVED